MKFNLVTKITILALWIFLVTVFLIQMLVHTQVRNIIIEEQDKALEQRLNLVLAELARKNDRLSTTYAHSAQLGVLQEEILTDLQLSHLRKTDEKSFIFVVDAAGTVLWHPHLSRGSRSLAPVLESAEADTRMNRTEYRNSKGQAHWAVYSRFPDWGWTVCCSVPVRDKSQAFTLFHRHLSLIMAGAFVVMGLFLAYFLTQMLKPVSRLTKAANKIAEGNMDQPVDISGNDEIATLARAFDKMQNALNAKIAQLRKSEIKYRSLVQYANSVILRWDRSGRVIFLNNFGENLFGFRLEEIVGKNVVGTIIADKGATGRELTDTIDDIVSHPGQYMVSENENVCRDGRRVWIQWSNNAIVDEQGNLLEMLSVGIDITERKETEQKLREAEKRYHALFESAYDAILISTADGICIDCNRKALELFGCSREEMIGRPHEHFFPPVQPDGTASRELVKRINGKALAGDPQTIEWQIKRADEKPREVLASVNCFKTNEQKYIQTVLTDVTRQKRIESKLQQAQKMEGIGTLAGGIAHDFNNILSAILGYTELAMMKAEYDQELTADLQQVRKASERAKELVRQILSFSRKGRQDRAVLQISLIVKEALKLIRSSIPTTIEIVEDVKSRAAVLTNPIQIHQLIMNLCTNAYQAMPDTGGTLTVSMHEKSITGDELKELQLSPGKYIHLEVSDTGSGMDPVTLEKIFDPFFTTKEKERGTGLGLAVVYDIVQEHQGGITVRSMPGEGTTFDIYLPVAREEAEDTGGLTDRMHRATGNERIMIVDDEEAIRTLLHAILANAGYRVETYANGREAWEVFKKAPGHWNLIITDQTMPQMTGEELALRVMHLRPGFPVILCSGFSEKINVEKARQLGITAYLPKPVSLNELLAAIHETLKHPDAAAPV